MFLCTLRHSRISDRTEGNLTAKKIVSNLSLLFIPTDQTKRPPCKTCIIHCSYDESLDSLKYLLKTAVFNSLAIEIHWQRIPRKETFPVQLSQEMRSLFTM